jgi:hypothetical protein
MPRGQGVRGGVHLIALYLKIFSGEFSPLSLSLKGSFRIGEGFPRWSFSS